MAHYLLTGAAGFIASAVARRLVDAGHSVVGIDNLNDAYDVRLKQWRLDQLQGLAGFTFQLADIVDRATVARIAGSARFDAVINLAARAGVRQSVENPWVYVETNVTGTLNLLEECRRTGIKKFVLASTSSLYGKHNPMPYAEDADTDRPLSPYAASKKAAEALCYSYHHLHGIDVSIVRYFTVYGPAGRPDMSLFRFVQWVSEGKPVTIYGDGSQTRDFTFVDDIARGTIAATKPLGFETINLGSDSPIALLELLRYVEARVGREARIVYEPMHPADVPATWADVGKAKKLLGWSPEVDWKRGVDLLVEWYGKNRTWASSIATG